MAVENHQGITMAGIERVFRLSEPYDLSFLSSCLYVYSSTFYQENKGQRQILIAVQVVLESTHRS